MLLPEVKISALTPFLCLQRLNFCAAMQSDPNRDPNAEKSRWIQADTVDRPPSRKHAKAPESVAEQRFPARIVSSHSAAGAVRHSWYKCFSSNRVLLAALLVERIQFLTVIQTFSISPPYVFFCCTPYFRSVGALPLCGIVAALRPKHPSCGGRDSLFKVQK